MKTNETAAQMLARARNTRNALGRASIERAAYRKMVAEKGIRPGCFITSRAWNGAEHKVSSVAGGWLSVEGPRGIYRVHVTEVLTARCKKLRVYMSDVRIEPDGMVKVTLVLEDKTQNIYYFKNPVYTPRTAAGCKALAEEAAKIYTADTGTEVSFEEWTAGSGYAMDMKLIDLLNGPDPMAAGIEYLQAKNRNITAERAAATIKAFAAQYKINL